MPYECSVSVGANGLLVIVDLRTIAHSTVQHLDRTLQRDGLDTNRPPAGIDWIEALSLHVARHLGYDCVVPRTAFVNGSRLGFTVQIQPGADAKVAREHVIDFLSLPVFGITVRQRQLAHS